MSVALRGALASGLAAAAVAATVGLPRVQPELPAWSAALAVPVAPLLFVALAGRAPRLQWPGSRRTAVVGGVLFVRAALEELFWRGLVLGAVAGAIVAPGALALSSIGFAYAHRRCRHAVSGGAFGALYLATGRLVAPIAAHGLYNLIVWADRHQVTEAAPRAAAAELRAASKRFGDAVSLEAVDLEVRAGEIVALLGPNGAGKSTAVSLLLGLRRPGSGRAFVFGRDPRDPVARRQLGSMPQEVDVSPTLTVREIVGLVRAHFPNPAPLEPLLERFDLTGLAARQGGGLSGGERRRLAVALAFAGRPRLLVLDEPTAGLDVASRRALWEAVADHRERGGAVLLTTHYLEEAAALADRVAVIARGRIVAEGSVDDVRSRLTTARVWLRTTSLPALAHALRVDRSAAGTTIQTDDPAALLRELVAREVPLDGIEVRQPTLEDAVLELADGGGT
ncbi:MAG TPA: ATP-binding cassette domain-containing protein [Gaiellaceae bacterium]